MTLLLLHLVVNWQIFTIKSDSQRQNFHLWCYYLKTDNVLLSVFLAYYKTSLRT